MATFEKRVKQLEQGIEPKKALSLLWVGDPPKNYDANGRLEGWTPADFNKEYEGCRIFIPAKTPIPCEV